MNQTGLKHPGRWIWLLLLVPAVLGLMRLRLDVDVFGLLPSDLSVVQGLKLHQEHFANARELLITLETDEAEVAEAAARAVARALRLKTSHVASVTWEAPWMEHPDQAAELLAYLWFNQEPSVFRDLTNRLDPGKLVETLAATREQLATSMSPPDIAQLSYDPFGLTRLPEEAADSAPSFMGGREGFGSADGRFRILFVQARSDLRTYRDCNEWLDVVRPAVASTLASLGLSQRIAVQYTGRPAFVAEIANGMRRDVNLSVGGTAAIIALLFWLAHRRIKPLLWLLALLAMILGCTLALGGLVYGGINVVSMGFAAILLGLAVDYAVVHYQEALAHPNLTIPQIRRAIAPSILWAAVTTIAAFLALNLGGLPGLGQLGTLVGLGVALAALVMVFEFLPPLFPERRRPRSIDPPSSFPGGPFVTEPLKTRDTLSPFPPRAVRLSLAATAALLGASALVLMGGLPGIDPTANALRPRNSAAYMALDKIQSHWIQDREPLWLIVGGASDAEVARNLEAVRSALGSAKAEHLISSFTLPTSLWPHPEYQRAIRRAALQLAGLAETLRQAALTNGFTEVSLGLAERMLKTWQTAGNTPGTFVPANEVSHWVLDKLTSRAGSNYFALGIIHLPTNHPSASLANHRLLESRLPRDDVWLSGWPLLGGEILGRVQANVWRVLGPMVALVLLSLWLAFRRLPEILLSAGVLLLSGICLLAWMRLADWSWNLLNLMAIPLILGTGVDYSIFMQLALRRYHGDWRMTFHSVGRALLLCGGTAIAGFSSLSLSSNAGMAGLGRVCAVGIAFNMLIGIFVLPGWWSRLAQPGLRSNVPA